MRSSNKRIAFHQEDLETRRVPNEVGRVNWRTVEQASGNGAPEVRISGLTAVLPPALLPGMMNMAERVRPDAIALVLFGSLECRRITL